MGGIHLMLDKPPQIMCAPLCISSSCSDNNSQMAFDQMAFDQVTLAKQCLARWADLANITECNHSPAYGSGQGCHQQSVVVLTCIQAKTWMNKYQCRAREEPAV